MAELGNSEFHLFSSENVGYKVPGEILEGDFRIMEGEPDPDAQYASQIVAKRMEQPTQEIFEAVHKELSRLRKTFDDIHSKGETVSLEAYWYARDLFDSRIEAIMKGEQDLPKW